MMGGGACLLFVLYFVLVRIVLYFRCRVAEEGEGGREEIGSILIRQKMVPWRVVRRARSAIVSLCCAVRLRVIISKIWRCGCHATVWYSTHDVEAHPLIRFEQQVAQASRTETK
jgi:hypothetical protein